jgi:hypothetical protein
MPRVKYQQDFLRFFSIYSFDLHLIAKHLQLFDLNVIKDEGSLDNSLVPYLAQLPPSFA